MIMNENHHPLLRHISRLRGLHVFHRFGGDALAKICRYVVVKQWGFSQGEPRQTWDFIQQTLGIQEQIWEKTHGISQERWGG